MHLREVARRWVEWGHEVTLFCGKYKGCKESEVMDGVETIRRGDPYTVYLHATKQYLWNLRKRDYDFIIDDVNGVPFFTPLYVQRPKVAIMHHLVQDIFFKELPWHKAIVGCATERMIPLIYQNTPFIAVSDSTKKDLIEFGIQKEDITVIYNGINHEIYRVNPRSKSLRPYVIYLGRIKRYKNLDHLLKAMKIVIEQLQRSQINMDPILTIAGRGGYEELKELTNRLGITEYVQLLGEISEAEKVTLLQDAIVYITASMREGWGLGVTEAAACGTPAIAYEVPGLRDTIINDETGLLTPYGNIESLAEAVLKVLTDKTLRAKLSRNAFKWANNFSWEETAKETLKVIKKIMEQY